MRAAALAWLLACSGLGCALDMGSTARSRAQAELHCTAPALRLRGVGHLRIGSGYTRELTLYEASGCDQEQLYYCSKVMRRCERDLGAVVPHGDVAVVERAHAVLRQAARARCPESELRVIQESESLFRFESCDGAWLYHCRARGCERLPAR